MCQAFTGKQNTGPLASKHAVCIVDIVVWHKPVYCRYQHQASSTLMIVTNWFSTLKRTETFYIYAAPSGPPQNVSGLSINATSIMLSWRAPRFEDRNGAIRHYIINVTELETRTKFGAITTQMAITFSSLHPYYTYLCTVYAVTIGAGPGAVPVNVTTMEDSKCSSVLWCM